MQLRLHSTPTRLFIYREKWGTLLFGLALGLLSVALGLVYGLGYYHWVAGGVASRVPTFVAVLSAVFVLVGGMVLLRLPQEARKLRAQGGSPVLLFNALGAQVWAGIGGEATTLPWSAVDEVVIAQRLKIAERFESTFHGRVAILFLAQPASRRDGWRAYVDRYNLSGADRPYLFAEYPRAAEAAAAEALRRFAPATLRVQTAARVVFDLRHAKDTVDPLEPGAAGVQAG